MGWSLRVRGSRLVSSLPDPEDSGNSKTEEIRTPGLTLLAPPLVKLEKPVSGVRSLEAQRLKIGGQRCVLTLEPL